MDRAEEHELKYHIRKQSEAIQSGALVCDSLNMCKEREDFLDAYGEFEKTLNFCPFCGKEWLVSAITEKCKPCNHNSCTRYYEFNHAIIRGGFNPATLRGCYACKHLEKFDMYIEKVDIKK